MALIIFALTLIAFLSWAKVIVDMKLIIVWFDLNFKFLIIFSPTVGVTDKNIQSHELIISWLSLLIVIFLNFFFKVLDIDLFLWEMIIFTNSDFFKSIFKTVRNRSISVRNNYIFIWYIRARDTSNHCWRNSTCSYKA